MTWTGVGLAVFARSDNAANTKSWLATTLVTMADQQLKAQTAQYELNENFCYISKKTQVLNITL